MSDSGRMTGKAEVIENAIVSFLFADQPRLPLKRAGVAAVTVAVERAGGLGDGLFSPGETQPPNHVACQRRSVVIDLLRNGCGVQYVAERHSDSSGPMRK